MDLQEVLAKVEHKELDGMSAAELGEAFILLSDKPEYKGQLKEVAAAINAKANEDKGHQAAEQVSEETFTKNAVELNKYSEQAVLDEESKKALENLEVVTKDGKKVNVAEEVNEAAKLRVTTDMVDRSAPLSQEEYNNAVHDEIARILSTIMIGKSTSSSGNSVQQANADAADLANLYQGKKVAVDASVITNALAVHTGETKQKLSGLKEKFKNSSFFKGMKERLARLDDKLSKKFGKAYTQPKAVVNTMIEQGTMTEAVLGGALGGAAIVAAGTAAAVPVSAAFGVYSVWIGARRIGSLNTMYQKEKADAKEKGKKLSFFDFAKTHKKDVAKTALYAGAAVAGVVSAFYTTAAATVEGAHSLSSAAMHAGASKLALTGAAIETPHVADFGEAVIKGDGKGAWNAAKRMGTAAAVFAGTVWAGQEIAGALHADTPAPTGNNGSNAVAPADSTTNEAPVDTGVDSTDTMDTPDTNTTAADAAMDPIVVGSREQAVYVRNLKLVPDSDIMLANIRDGIVEIPDGMTPEMAVNMGRIEQLNYGDSRILQALRGCDEVNINLKDELYNLTKVTYTEIDGVHHLGDHIDFRGDPNIHGRINSIDCDKVKVSRIISHPVHHDVTPTPQPEPEFGEQPVPHPEPQPDPVPNQANPDTPASPVEPVPEPQTPVDETPNKNLGWGHYNNAAEFEQAVQNNGVQLNEGTTVDTQASGGSHYDNAADMVNKNSGLENATLDDSGKLVDANGKPVNATLTGKSMAEILLQLNNAGNSQ